MNSTDAMYGAAPKRFQMPICDKTLNTEISNDFTLPDYQPEIRRVLRVTPQILPPAKYISGNSAELSGTIDYDLLYVGSDGALYSAPLSAEYSMSTPLDISSDFDLNEGVLIITDISDENMTTRLTSPRKLTVKCRLACRVKAYGMMITDERMSGEVDPMSIERLDRTCNASVVRSGFGETVEVSDEISQNYSDTRVINASATANISDISTFDGYANFKGDVLMKLIVCSEGNPSSTENITKKIPFSDRVEIDDLMENANCVGSAHVSDIKVTVEDGRILCNINLIPEITAYANSPITYTKDIYSTENLCECEYREYTLPTLIGVADGNFSQNERILLADTPIQQGARLVDIWCKPFIEKLDSERDKYTLCGNCKYTLLLESDGEYFTSELSYPFRYATELPVKENAEHFSNIDVLSCKCKMDGGSIGIDSELYVNSAFFGEEKITALSEVNFGESVEKSNGDIVVCFPSPDDTAWSVSKKYFVPVSKIVGASSPTDTLSGYVVINS